MDPDPRRLELLAAVARAGGVLAAARLLHVTPSAVSQQLARLEAEAGVALVVRVGRRISLTDAGAALAERGERIRAEVAGARADLARLTDRASGTVTVIAFPTAVAALVAPAAVELAERHPGITLHVQEHAEEQLEAVRTGAADIVISERDAEAVTAPVPGVRDVPLLDDRYLLAVPATWPRPEQLVEVAARPWVVSSRGSAAEQVLLRAARAGGWQPRVAHRALEFPAVLALVAAGLGAALLPRLALPDPDGRLARQVQAVPVPGLGARRLVARHRHSRHEPAPAVVAVLAALAGVAAASAAAPVTPPAE